MENQSIEALFKLADLAQRTIYAVRLDALKSSGPDKNPNYNYLFDSLKNQRFNENKELVEGKVGVALEGSSRSGKTWSGVDLIIYICKFLETSCTINIYRETYNEFKTTLYDDFKRRLDYYGLPNPFHTAKEIQSFKIGQSTIHLLGDGKHGGGCDYAFYNEVMFIKNSVFDQSEMRCRKFWWADYNPSVTDHWFFDKVLSRPEVGFLRTTYKDNPHISPTERSKIEGYNPYEEDSCVVIDDDLYYRNPKSGRMEVVSDINQPPPHPINVKKGTADPFNYKVYALGLRGAMKGVIFDKVYWIDEFPKNIGYFYANDFGFTADPNVLVKYAEDKENIWIEALSYSPYENADRLEGLFLDNGVDRGLPIACDSSDKYTAENKGTVEMVRDLKKRGWKAFKISKTKSVMFWINSMKRKRIHIVWNENNKTVSTAVKKEQQNYRMKEINGISINQPIDKYNHFWDAARYGHIAYNSTSRIYKNRKSLSALGVNP